MIKKLVLQFSDWLIAPFMMGILFVMGLLMLPQVSEAATLQLSPSTGTYSVGSTFDVSVFLNTEGKAVNAIELDVSFPPDKLQLVNPKTSLSVIEVWTGQPKFNNQIGTINLQGGVPNGINLSNALVATLTFRVKSVGTAIVKFQDQSRVLLNNGLGTDDLQQKVNAVYSLILPPPQGPTIVSETHPEQGSWYAANDVIFSWANDFESAGYSYVLDKNPNTIPDDISEGDKRTVAYTDLADGVHYFHIKSRREDTWGGTSHFSVSVDTLPPAAFPLEVSPATRTSLSQPIIRFRTTDNFSGVDHYELKTIPISKLSAEQSDNYDQSLFIEAQSPFILNPLERGTYDVIVRAYDVAGNFQEVTQKIYIVGGLFSFSGADGLIIRGFTTIPWIVLLLALLVVDLLMFYLVTRLRLRHRRLAQNRSENILPDHVQDQLKQLHEYRRRYGDIAAIILIVGVSLFGVPLVASAADPLNPPLIETYAKAITNEEIFYVEGQTDVAMAEVVLYTQNAQTGETTSRVIDVDERGRWFYRHDAFFAPGRYVMWLQTKLGDEFSPPSPQFQVVVQETAISIGSSRISYAVLFGALTILFGLLIVIMGIYIVYSAIHYRHKKARFAKEIREAEEAVRRGFAVIRRDIENQLKTLNRADGNLTEEEQRLEKELHHDLQIIEDKIGKEIWDLRSEV